MKNVPPKGAVAAGHRLTADAAVEILRDGGTAIDAAIAALAMSCLCEPVLSSPGGGGFAMLRNGVDKTTSLIDFFPQTPIERRQTGENGVEEILADFGTATQKFHIGPATSATPGFFAGIEMLYAKGAKLPMADLFAPAMKAARNGVKITPFQHYLSTVVQPILTASTRATQLFVPDGSVLKPGEIFKNPGLADAFEIYCRDGFSNSEIGRSIVSVQKSSGHLTGEDIGRYRAIERPPLVIEVGAATISLNPLPAASGTLIAHTLDQIGTPGTSNMAQALLATGNARNEVKGDLAKLISTPIRQRGTTHISIIDGAGNACAVTLSNGEGNGELVGDFGFMLNNILGEEDVNPQGSQGWPLDTRLASMMCPVLIETKDGALAALGSGGSNRIRSALAQVVMHHCLEGMGLKEAIAAPRLHLEGEHLDFEDLFDAIVRKELCQSFPNYRAWPETNMYFGGVHAASRLPDGRFFGVGDARRDGVAIVVE